MSAMSCHPEDVAALWVTIGGKCPLIIIDFEYVDVIDTYLYNDSNTSNNNNNN